MGEQELEVMDKDLAIVQQGHCQCGCGRITKTNRVNDSSHGWTKGEHKRFISGHNLTSLKGKKNGNWKGGRRLSRYGYALVSIPSHPRASSNGYVLEHLVMVEDAIGKALPPGACVHHINENRADNSHGNLVVC